MKIIKRVLLTGANGFIGKYLCLELERLGYHVILTSRYSESELVSLDVLNEESVQRALQEQQPDCIMHLAGQSSVVRSWEFPQETVKTNVIGTMNVLEAVRKICPDSRVILFSSSHEYGQCRIEQIQEEQTVKPVSPYAVSKAAQTMMGSIYHAAYGLDVVTLRLFNQIGVGQSLGFVLPDFASQVAKIEKELQPPVIHVGDLSGIRDFVDIRDSVRQMVRVMEAGKSGEIYHIGSGKGMAVKILLDIIVKEAKRPIQVVSNAKRRVQNGNMGYYADLTKTKQLYPELSTRPIEETVREVLNEWRQKDACCD